MDRYSNLLLADDLDAILEFDIEAIHSQATFESIVTNDILLGKDFLLGQGSSKEPLERKTLNCCHKISASSITADSYQERISSIFPECSNISSLDLSTPSSFKRIRTEKDCFKRLVNTSLFNESLPYSPLDIPESIVNLFSKLKPRLSDFSFVYTISAQMCQEIMPMECYVELKIGLLLSLTSIQTNSNLTPLHIVGIGPDTSFANLLMTQVGYLAKRFITFIDKYQSSALKTTNAFEANSLVLSKGGVYYSGDWSRLNDGAQSKILRDISCGSVAIDNSSLSCCLDSAIWCYWRNYKNNSKDMKTFSTLLKVFGIPFVLEETSTETLANFLLERAISPVAALADDDLAISIEDMKTYVKVISGRNVQMPVGCAELLKNYFIASRHERPECLPERAFLSLRQMAESFARLSFRDHVVLTDVIGAIYLCEHFIKNIFGPGVFPPPKISTGNDLEHVENIFKDFQNWVYVYLARFTPNNNTNIE